MFGAGGTSTGPVIRRHIKKMPSRTLAPTASRNRTLGRPISSFRTMLTLPRQERLLFVAKLFPQYGRFVIRVVHDGHMIRVGRGLKRKEL